MSLVISISITIILSAFFSGMEIAFVSSNKLRIEIDKKKGKPTSKLLSVFTKYPSHYIATMLIGNNIALVIYGIVFIKVVNPYFENLNLSEGSVLALQTVLSTLVILFFAEFIPKTIFRINPNRTLRFFTIPIMFFYIILYPITQFTTWLSNIILHLFFNVDKSKQNQKTVFNRYDLDDLFSSQEEIQQNQQEVENDIKLFKNAMDFTNIKLKECIVPRNEIEAIDVTENINTAIQKFTETGYSRLLVYSETIDNIIGYIHTIDMFKQPENLKSIVHTLPIAPETMAANKLLEQFIAKKKSIALIVDEFGGTAGIVTFEDIIEEIFGEIEDEHDKKELKEEKLNETKFIFSGRLEIDYINEKYGIQLPDNDDYETLAGFILHHTENIPTTNQKITINQYTITITKATGSKIEEVLLQINE